MQAQTEDAHVSVKTNGYVPARPSLCIIAAAAKHRARVDNAPEGHCHQAGGIQMIHDIITVGDAS